MQTLTVKLPRPVNRRLREKARQLGRSKSDLAREWIERGLDQQDQPSCHDVMKEACGHVPGSPGASIKEGFGA